MQRRFVIYIVLFFTPVILGYVTAELLTLRLPMGYKNISNYLSENKSEIEVLVLGSSQLKDAINPELLKQNTINLASGNQHHDTDFKLLKGLQPDLPKLKTVVLEVSYSHFELPHNGKDFWKNNIYLKYYGINAFERRTYFKDKLVFVSFPSFFSKKIVSDLKGEEYATFSKYGFDTNNYFGRFKNLDYNEAKIANTNFKINFNPNPAIFDTNSKLFFEMLDFLQKKNIQTIIATAPMYKTYLPKRETSILKRRDSILNVVKQLYPQTVFLQKEEDTINYSVRSYWNQSHLNPDGAAIFTKSLSNLLDDLD